MKGLRNFWRVIQQKCKIHMNVSILTVLSALSSSLSQWKLDTNEIRGYVSDNDNNVSVTCQLLNIQQQQNIHNHHNTFLTQHFLTKVVSSVTQLS